MDEPIFIVGAPRSGNTLLGCLLNKHDKLSVFFEFNLFSDLRPRWYRKVTTTNDDSTESFVDFFFSWQREWIEEYTSLEVERANLLEPVVNADKSWSARMDALMSRLGEMVAPDTKRWGDKTPHNLKEIPKILEEYPSAQIIHIYRDPRHVVNSMSDSSFTPTPNAPLLNAEIVRSFHRSYRQAKRGLGRAQRKRLFELRYESLIETPKKTLREVFDFLGENYTDTILEPADQEIRGRIGWSDYKGWGQLESQRSSRADTLPRAVEGHLAGLVESLGYNPTSRQSRCSRFFERLPAYGFRYLGETLRQAWLTKYPEANDYILTYLPKPNDYFRWSVTTMENFTNWSENSCA